MKPRTICCVAGKSGGHIIPCLTVIQHTTNTPQNILFFSANTPLDKTILSENPLVTKHVMLPLSSRSGSVFKTFWYTCQSLVKSFFYLNTYRPESIITTGGIVAIPVCIAGFILRIPITLYSLDAVPGKAIRALTPLATSIVTCFKSAQHYFPAHKCTVAPYPIKYTAAEYNNKQNAQKHLGINAEKKTIVVLGGSQGSLFLNECIKQFVTEHSNNAQNLHIIHQTGSSDSTDWNAFYESHNISAHVFSYQPHLEKIYAAADIIICRAGAGTLFEIKFFNKPCIIIPLKTHTTDHQVDNARAMSREYPELFYMITQSNVEKDPTILFTKIRDLLHQI